MQQLLFSLNATLPIFFVMVIGYVLRQLKLVDEPFVKTLNSFNFKVTLPALLFQDLASSDFAAVWDTTYVLYCFLVTLSCILLIWFLAAKFFHNKELIGEFVQSSYRGSAAVLGIAFIQNIYGSSGMAPLMIFATVPLYNIAAVIILSLTSPEQGGLSKETLLRSAKKVATNPIIIGILAGALASLLPFSFPPILQKTLSNVACLATPLALIGLGAGFEGRKAIALLRPTIVCTLTKLMLQPAVFLPLAVYLGFRDEKLIALLVMLGAPTTVSCYIMAKNMGHKGVLTSSVVVASTFFSSVSMTFWIWLLRMAGLI